MILLNIGKDSEIINGEYGYLRKNLGSSEYTKEAFHVEVPPSSILNVLISY